MRITAPGKILLLGGFAVLDYHPALSVAVLDGRGEGAGATAKKGSHRLISKEFGIDAEFDPNNPLEAASDHGIAKSAYAATLAYLSGLGHKPEPMTVELENSPIFGSRDEKSGLGSSAASTVALVSALMEANGHSLDKERDRIHRIAQVSHALATGKVGSGFDIATSAFGTIEYVRFERGAISLGWDMEYGDFCRGLKETVHHDWPRMSVKKAGLGPYGVIAFNIRGGKTSTMSSVKSVRKLVEHTPELYENLIRGQVEGEKEVFGAIAGQDREGIREGMRQARRYQRMLSDWVGRIGLLNFDPIEPPELTGLIERAEKLDGIVAGRCPGSGGYDSVAFLTEGKADIEGIVGIGKELGVKLQPLDIKVTGEGARIV